MIPIANGAYSVEVGFGSVWVAAGDPPSTLYRIDPESGRIVASVAFNAFGDAVVGEGAVWAYYCRIGPATNTVDATAVPGLAGGEDVPCNPALAPRPTSAAEEREREERARRTQTQGIAVAAGEGALWAIGVYDKTGSILRLDPTSGEVVATIDLGIGEVAGTVALGHGALWVATQPGASRGLILGSTRGQTRWSRRSSSTARRGPSLRARAPCGFRARRRT